MVHTTKTSEAGAGRAAFGLFLSRLRLDGPRKIKQREILAHLPGWTPSSYSRLESGEIAPPFEELVPLYRALCAVGVEFSPYLRQQFVEFARERIALQKTYTYRHTDEEWARLRFLLARLDGLPEASVPRPVTLMEAGHLVGRESFRQALLSILLPRQPVLRKKFVVLHGPMGIGKSSELHWLATYLLHHMQRPPHVLFCDLGEVAQEEPEKRAVHALDIVLATVFAELGDSYAQTAAQSVEGRLHRLVDLLARHAPPLVILLDHGEYLLQEYGHVAAPWERFVSTFLRYQHQATVVLASRQWSGWFGGEYAFVEEMRVPPLSQEQAVLLLQRLGLDALPVSLLQDLYNVIGGIPLCLEWVATLVKQSLAGNDGTCVEPGMVAAFPPPASVPAMTQAVRRLLDEPQMFGGSVAGMLGPLLERVLSPHTLSAQAQHTLEVLAVSAVPLARPAWDVVCQEGTHPLNELRRSSLLAAYVDRVQLLPMVASAVLQRMTPQQRSQCEVVLIQAYTAWLEQGIFHEHERGAVITELAALLLTHHRFLEAAQLLIRYGWLSFNLGHGTRLAHLMETLLQGEQQTLASDPQQNAGRILAWHILTPYLDKPLERRTRYLDYQQVYDLLTEGTVSLSPFAELHIVHHLMASLMEHQQFEEAQRLLEKTTSRLAPALQTDADLRASLWEKRTWLFGSWSDVADVQGLHETVGSLREQAIECCRQCQNILQAHLAAIGENAALASSISKKRLARSLTNLGYYLNRAGRYEEALDAINRSLALKEQGYTQPGSLAAAYGEKSQILASLGRFQEAIQCDTQAMDAICQQAHVGYAPWKDDIWMYRINRGRLYLRLGRIEEAEQLLQEALPHVDPDLYPKRSIYSLFARQALREIDAWRAAVSASTSGRYSEGENHLPRYQIDWRWVERYRELTSYDSFWWLTPVGPFTSQEQERWHEIYRHPVDAATRAELSSMMVASREREIMQAISQGREPQFHYPTIDRADVRRRLFDLACLDEEIAQNEPNVLVRGLYHDAIREEICFLHLIEATDEGNSEQFWEWNVQLNGVPTTEEVTYALSRVRAILAEGMKKQETEDIAHRLLTFMQDHFSLPLLPASAEGEQDAFSLIQEKGSLPLPSSDSSRLIAPEIARRFFEDALQRSGYEGWHVGIDSSATGARVEQGMRCFFLANTPLSLEKIRHFLSHELAGHVARCVAGEHSSLGLLGVHTGWSLETEEGLALYQDRQAQKRSQQPYDDSGEWIGTLATGLASGVVVSPQTFLPLLEFFEAFFLLRRLLKQPNSNRDTVQQQAFRQAVTRCLRTFRGVPDLSQAGICYTKDALYLRGIRKIERAVAQDSTVLERLMVGVVALEQLPDLQELQIVHTAIRPLTELAEDPGLETSIASFENQEDAPETPEYPV